MRKIIDWNKKDIYEALGRPDLKYDKKEMFTLVCSKCGNRDFNYGDVRCDTCELYGKDFEVIEKWKFEVIKLIKEH